MSGESESKILTREQLLDRRQLAKAAGRRVVHCHGCFDIVHPGHIRHLRYAKSLGDILLVSITGDSRVGKGVGRPLIPEELRAENLAALDFVDWVHIEPRPTAAELLADVRPDVYVKGREYENNNDPRFANERSIVERHGGRVVFSSGDVVFSSTALIAAMEQSVDPFHKRLTQLLETPELGGPPLYELISRFRGVRVLVVGETIIDTYVMCDRPEVAGESPVMTLRPVERRQFDGGAAIIARHLAAMGARPVLLTALPADEDGGAMRRRLLTEGIELRTFPTTTPIAEKQRFLVGAQKVMKLDLVDPLVLDATEQDQLIAMIDEAARGCQAAIIADFGLGLFGPRTLTRACLAARPHVSVLTGDVSGRRSSLLAMRSMDLLCPSESEARDALRMQGEGLPLVVWKLLEETDSRGSIVTMGPEGLIGFDRLPEASGGGEGFATRLKSEHIPALAPLAIDQLGAGDSLLAAATLSLAAGSSVLAASFLGACAAATQVQRLGNVPIGATDLRQFIARVHNAHLAFTGAEMLAQRPISRLESRLEGKPLPTPETIADTPGPVPLAAPAAAQLNPAGPNGPLVLRAS